MGNLSDILMNSGRAPLQAAAGLVDLFAPQTAGPGGFAGPLPGGISETGAIPGSDRGQEIAVMGDPFKAKKRSIWGVLGDAILLNSGHKGPFFKDRVEKKNYTRAMEGFTQDPMAAIRRIATFDPESAWKMYGQMRDDQRGDEAQQRLMGKDKETLRQRGVSMLGRIKDDGSNYHVVRPIYNDYITRNGIEAPLLPEEFNIDEIEAYFMSGQKPSEVAMDEVRRMRESRQTEQGDRRLDQNDRKIGITERNVESQIESREVRDQVAVRGVSVREQAEARQGKKASGATEGGRKVRTKYGLGDVDPSGKYLRVKGPDGSTYIYRSTGGDNWSLMKKL
jgi:hypothetical protein